jgi:CheY-like chemotaxis protein
MPSGGILAVTTEIIEGNFLKTRFGEANSGRYVRVAVSDTGVGMEEALRDRIFEPFFSTKTKDKGTGLGLAVVFGVVRSHHAFVEVESIPDKGSTFSLFFPLPSIVDSTVTPGEEKTEDEPGGNETILLVEDEETLSSLISMFLSGKGYRVLTAADGEAAVQVLQAHVDEVALVFVDLDLPRLNGWDAYKKMKVMNPSLKAILTSGFVPTISQEEMMKGGIRVFLPKPYAPEEVIKRIREELDQSPDYSIA